MTTIDPREILAILNDPDIAAHPDVINDLKERWKE